MSERERERESARAKEREREREANTFRIHCGKEIIVVKILLLHLFSM